jgi:seryl-tRNA synthetase
VDKSLHSALSELNAAINGLENAIDTRLDREREAADVEGLAQELDQAEFRANRLEEVNREVSSRLVTAMETIRAVLDR